MSMITAELIRPSFFLVGPMKTATTSLYFGLKNHPRIKAPIIKETQFFTRGYRRGMRWYARRFPERTHPNEVTFDATPIYFADPRAPVRMLDSGFRGAKIIVGLRDPVERFVSHYLHAHGWHKAIQSSAAKPEWLQTLIARNPKWKGETRGFDDVVTDVGSQYHLQSCYILHLPTWFQLFGNENVFVYDTRQLRHDWRQVTTDLQRFVGLPVKRLPETVVNDRRTWNVTEESAGITPEAKARLRRYFEPYNAALTRQFGLGEHWNEPPSTESKAQ